MSDGYRWLQIAIVWFGCVALLAFTISIAVALASPHLMAATGFGVVIGIFIIWKTRHERRSPAMLKGNGANALK